MTTGTLTRRALASALALGIAVVSATQSAAQDTRWRVTSIFGRAEGQIAAFCPVTTPAGDPTACFGFVCPAGRPMGWVVIAPDGQYGQGFNGAITIDGRSYGTLAFQTQRAARGRTLYYSRFQPGTHDALMAAVRAGNRLNMTVSTSAGTTAFPQVSLVGSMAALNTIAPQCTL
ncbi:MAG: hypothetical protein JJT81_06290 [Rubellimicrobium sp.]|nr:hypothetical protein [Rubellimicrobium sp.]